MQIMKRMVGTTAAAGALVAGAVLTAAPAQAGGPTMIYEDTLELCQAQLDVSIDETQTAGYRVENISPCQRVDDGSWGASFDVVSAT